MRITANRPRNLVTVRERSDGCTVSLHKYQVVDDRRRDGEIYGKHAHSELEGLTVRYEESVTFRRCRMADRYSEPVAAVDEELRDAGATVLPPETDDAADDEPAKREVPA